MNSCLQASPPAQPQLQALDTIRCAGGGIYPNLYKWLYTGWKHGYKLETVIRMITGTDTKLNKNGKDYMSLSMRQILNGHNGGGLDTWQKYLKAWVSWGLLEQHKPQDGERSIQAERNAIAYAKEQAKTLHLRDGHLNPTLWYHLPEYTPELLEEADKRASEYTPSRTKADWILNAGKKEADRIHHDKRGISKDRKATQEAIETTLTACIYTAGYVTDKTLIEATEADTGLNRGYISNTLRGIRHSLMKRYHLQWCRPSKEQVTAYGLSGYSYIYTPKMKR